MSTNFPGALDALTNPLGSDSLAAVSHAAQHTNANDAIEALEVRVGITGSADTSSITYRLSADGEGAALAALTTKATPVDADLVALSDSAAGGVLKKLSWSSIKTALQSMFATLAGIAGGQTLIGGTEASETLTLRSTAHATKGKILFGSISAFDEANNRIGIGKNNPSYTLDVNGAACVSNSGFLMRNAADAPTWRISGGGTGAENLYISAFTPTERYLFAIDRTGDMGYGSYITVLRTGTVIRPNTDAAMNDRVSLRVYGGSGITRDLQQWLNTSGIILGIVDYLGKVGFGVTAASAKLHVVDTSEQLRIGYDAANYASMTVNSTGQLKFSAPLTWRPPASITPAVNGDLTVEATSNTQLTFRLKGTDGTVRSASLTLA